MASDHRGNPMHAGKRTTDEVRSQPPVRYSYASQDPPDPPDPNKKTFGNNNKTPPKSDY
jgi:hypothetical protein